MPATGGHVHSAAVISDFGIVARHCDQLTTTERYPEQSGLETEGRRDRKGAQRDTMSR